MTLAKFGGALCAALALIWTGPAQAQAPLPSGVETSIQSVLPRMIAWRRDLHQNPELSYEEVRTARTVAQHLRTLRFDDVRTGVARTGVVGVLRGGRPGPVIALRADMDALPVEEKTGVPYASKVRGKNDAGLDVGVMHACGHDVHMTSFVGTARMMAQLKDQWRGTLLMVGQPAEEAVGGAIGMVQAGIYQKFGKADFAIALHDTGDLPAGKIGYTPGYALASSTSVDLRVRGVGGHGSRPDNAKDPIVLAAQIVLALQTIVSREISPFDPAVVTVGSIHGGTRHNIIPDDVNLQLTIRTYKEEVRQHILKSIERIARNIAVAANVPADRMPEMRVSGDFAPATYNDPALTERIARAIERAIGKENTIATAPVMGAEDFGHFGMENRQVPIAMFWVGATDPAKFAAAQAKGQPVPSLHSSEFAPLPEPTLRTGVKAMTAAALELLKK